MTAPRPTVRRPIPEGCRPAGSVARSARVTPSATAAVPTRVRQRSPGSCATSSGLCTTGTAGHSAKAWGSLRFVERGDDDQPAAAELRVRAQAGDQRGAVDARQRDVDDQHVGLQLPAMARRRSPRRPPCSLDLRKLLADQQAHWVSQSRPRSAARAGRRAPPRVAGAASAVGAWRRRGVRPASVHRGRARCAGGRRSVFQASSSPRSTISYRPHRQPEAGWRPRWWCGAGPRATSGSGLARRLNFAGSAAPQRQQQIK